jgi:adenosine deaminase
MAARTAAHRGSYRLVGFGLTGDERQCETAQFREAFAIARAEGLRTTAHAGEHLGVETIIEAIEVLGLDRVGHGVRAAASPEVMRNLAGLGTPLEICIASNVALGVCSDVGEHPIATLAEAGCAITLGTDDPWQCYRTLAQECWSILAHPPVLEPTVSPIGSGGLCGLESQSGIVRAALSGA